MGGEEVVVAVVVVVVVVVVRVVAVVAVVVVARRRAGRGAGRDGGRGRGSGGDRGSRRGVGRGVRDGSLGSLRGRGGCTQWCVLVVAGVGGAGVVVAASAAWGSLRGRGRCTQWCALVAAGVGGAGVVVAACAARGSLRGRGGCTQWCVWVVAGVGGAGVVVAACGAGGCGASAARGARDVCVRGRPLWWGVRGCGPGAGVLRTGRAACRARARVWRAGALRARVNVPQLPACGRCVASRRVALQRALHGPAAAAAWLGDVRGARVRVHVSLSARPCLASLVSSSFISLAVPLSAFLGTAPATSQRRARLPSSLPSFSPSCTTC